MMTKKITAAIAALFTASSLAVPAQPSAEAEYDPSKNTVYTTATDAFGDNFFPLIDGEDVPDYVAKTYDNTVDRIIYTENEMLDSVNGDIREIDVEKTLKALGFLPDSITHKTDTQYSNVYSVDITGTEWCIEWTLAEQFGNSTTNTASYVAFKKGEDFIAPGNYMQVYVGGNSICFDNGALNKGVNIEKPIERMANEPAKVVITEGEFCATVYDFAVFSTVYYGIQRAEQLTTLQTESATTTIHQVQSPQHIPSITEYYETKLNGLDLAKASSAINARLDRGADIRCLEPIDILKDLMPDKEIEVETTGTTVSYSVNDGTRSVRLKFDQLDPCDHYLTTIEMNGRYSGCTYAASIKCGFELSTERHIEATLNCDGEKKINVQLAEPEDINDFWLYEANGKPINSETISIVASLLTE
jgi:hypothetical protein